MGAVLEEDAHGHRTEALAAAFEQRVLAMSLQERRAFLSELLAWSQLTTLGAIAPLGEEVQ